MSRLLSIVAVVLAFVALTGTASAVTVNVVQFTNDAANDYPGIGISPTTNYTHKLDFPADGNPDTVNGVLFIAAGVTGANYSLVGVDSTFGGGSGNLMDDFNYGTGSAIGHVETDTISGLTPGFAYDLRFYTGPFGSRPQTALFTNGTETDSRTYDPGDNTQYLSYAYTAQGNSVTVSFTSQTDNNTFHQYAITNQVVPEPGSIVLLGLGAVGLFVVARRRQS